MCGNSVWEAAANVARRKAQLDATGLYLSSCRHQVTQEALNMYRGEIYAYPLLLNSWKTLGETSPLSFEGKSMQNYSKTFLNLSTLLKISKARQGRRNRGAIAPTI